MRALIESAAFIARPTARALGIFEFARMLSFCRWVSVSRFTVWLDLSEPHAPMHYAEGKHRTDQFPVSQVMGPGVFIDVSHRAHWSADYRVRPADITVWESAHGAIPRGAIVLIRTGWGSRWPDRARVLGTTKTGAAAIPELHFPGLDLDAARELARRKVNAVGIDTPSIDYGQSSIYGVHRRLVAVDIPAFENVANIEQLPATGAYVIALPFKIKGGSGGSVRAPGLVSLDARRAPRLPA